MRTPWLLALGLLVVCAGCASKEVPLPDAHPVPASSAEEMAAFQAPSLYVPPVEPTPRERPPEPPAQGPNEMRYFWEDGKATLVQVQVGYPTVIRLQPTEKITSIVDGDRAELSETEAAATTKQPQQEKQPQCSYGARWQYCRGISEGRYAPVEHVVFTATHAGHKSGLIVFTDQRTYYLELEAVKTTKTRLISWSVPPPPVLPPAPVAPSLLPPASVPRTYHTGYSVTAPGAMPDWAPVVILSDLPTVPSAKMYLRFPPVVLHQRMPLLRGMTEAGSPYLLNARQYGEWVVVDELAPRLELRRGAGDDTQRLVLTRGTLQTITCPGAAACPH